MSVRRRLRHGSAWVAVDCDNLFTDKTWCAITRDRPCNCDTELKPLPLSFDADSCEQRALRAEAQAT